MIFVFSLGGSVVAGRDAESLKQYAAALKELAASHQIYVVVGGGRIAREYIEKVRALCASQPDDYSLVLVFGMNRAAFQLYVGSVHPSYHLSLMEHQV